MSLSKSKQTLSSRYSSSSSKAKLSKAPMIAFLLILVALVVVIIISLVTGDKDTEVDSSAYNLVVTPEDIEEQLAGDINKVAPGAYDVCMNSTWTFKDSTSPSDNAYVENLITNNNIVNFSLKRNDTGEVIYESPYIPVGSKLKNIKLSDETLTKGNYDCTVTYHLVDGSYREISTLNISVNIIIQN